MHGIPSSQLWSTVLDATAFDLSTEIVCTAMQKVTHIVAVAVWALGKVIGNSLSLERVKRVLIKMLLAAKVYNMILVVSL
jgi:hypothetical protein